MPARSATVLSALLLLGACKPREPESLSAVADRLDFAMTPRLPAPEAGTYATTQTTARDPVIGELTRWHHYDAGLAGAASGLALAMVEDRGSVSRWELREALWRAGYPYPVFDARGWTVGAQQPPPRDVIAWLEATPRDEPMALMRARGRDSDAWVGMRAHPDIELGSIPRVATLGTALPLPVVAGGTWIASDGTGQVTEGTLDEGAALLLASAGEWMLVLQRGKVELARLPIYVGISPPSEPLLLLPESPPQDVTSEDVTEHARLLLRHVRNTYGMPAWKSSPMFDAAVGRYLQDPSQGARAVLATLGFPGSDAVVWACDAATVENCFDTWMWDPRRRDVLLTPRMDSYGLHASLDARGVHLTLLLLRAG